MDTSCWRPGWGDYFELAKKKGASEKHVTHSVLLPTVTWQSGKEIGNRIVSETYACGCTRVVPCGQCGLNSESPILEFRAMFL
jgi:hypothetical protein